MEHIGEYDLFSCSVNKYCLLDSFVICIPAKPSQESLSKVKNISYLAWLNTDFAVHPSFDDVVLKFHGAPTNAALH